MRALPKAAAAGPSGRLGWQEAHLTSACRPSSGYFERWCMATVKVEISKPCTVWHASQSAGLPARVASPPWASLWHVPQVANGGFLPVGLAGSWQRSQRTVTCLPRSG